MAYNGPTNFPDFTALDHSTQRRYEKSATLNVYFSNRSGKTGFVVWMNDEGPRDGGKSTRIKVELTVPQMSFVFATLKQMAEGKLDKKCYNIGIKSKYAGQQRLDTPRVVSRVLVRQHAETGVIGLTIVDGNSPPITFRMQPSELFEVVDEDKAPVSLAEVSRIETLAWVSSIEPVLSVLVATKTEEKKKDNNNGYKGRKDTQDEFTNSDEDIPF